MSGAPLVTLPLPTGLRGWIFPVEAAHSDVFDAHRHRQWELNLIERGRAAYLIDGRRVPLRRDTLIWLLPHQGHTLIERSDDLRMWVMVADPNHAAAVADEPGFERWRGWLGGVEDPEPAARAIAEADANDLSAQCQRLHAIQTQAPRRAAVFDAGLTFLLAAAWSAFESAPDGPAGSHLHPAVAAAADWLAQHSHTPEADDLDALARRVHLSRSQLSRRFSREVGCPLVEFKNRRRVQAFLRAAGRGGAVPLERAAERAGFGSYPQAFRVIRRITGYAPREAVQRAALAPDT